MSVYVAIDVHRKRSQLAVVDVGIGDVVKSRVDELETERGALTDYITGTR